LIYSTELRELEAQLKAAYMNKERAAQLAEKEALKYDQNVCTCTVLMHMQLNLTIATFSVMLILLLYAYHC
jgi:hypothetical protein